MRLQSFRYWMILVNCVLIALVIHLKLATAETTRSCVFYNPIIYPGEDPSVVFQAGAYYYVKSVNPANGAGIVIRKTAALTDLSSAQALQIWTAPDSGPNSKEIWAPELVFLEGQWFIYFAADEGKNANHRMYVLQADTSDPLGSWTFKGKIADSTTDNWAIDGTVFAYNDKLYMVWSGWPGDTGDFPQNLYIAPMSDPLTISGPRHLISEPDKAWEKSVAAINEGPEILRHNGDLFIVYSADASWSTAYKLGLLKFKGGAMLSANGWEKHETPVFSQYNGPDGVVYGPGHNGFTTSPDGKQD